jgi:hypothetical protein
MSIKLIILKSGESIVSDVKEGIVGEKVVAYILNTPCKVIVNGTYKILDDEDPKDRLSISLQPWPNLSNDKVVTIVVDWVVTIVEPYPDLKEMYEKQVLNLEEKIDEHQTVSFTEQSDSNNSD